MKAFAFLLLAFGIAVGSPAAPPAKPDVVDYFLRLPKDALESPAKAWLDLAKVDRAHGFIACEGDGAQPLFHVALFRFRNGAPLLAVGHAELEAKSPRLVALFFYEEAGQGALREVKRPEFPEKEMEHRSYELPRLGRTVVVRDLKSGQTVRKVTWDGEKFQPAK